MILEVWQLPDHAKKVWYLNAERKAMRIGAYLARIEHVRVITFKKRPLQSRSFETALDAVIKVPKHADVGVKKNLVKALIASFEREKVRLKEGAP